MIRLGSLFQDGLQVYQKHLSMLKHRAKIIIKETEQFLEKNPDELLAQNLEKLKTKIPKINENIENVENNLS